MALDTDPTPSAVSSPFGQGSVERWLAAVTDIVRAANRPLSLPRLLNLIAEGTLRITGYDFCAVLLADHERGQLVIEGSHGLSPAYVQRLNDERAVLLGAGPGGLSGKHLSGPPGRGTEHHQSGGTEQEVGALQAA